MRDAALELSRQIDDGRSSLLGRFFTFLFIEPIRAAQRRASLRHLGTMHDGALRDIGLTRQDLDLLARGRVSSFELEMMRTERWRG